MSFEPVIAKVTRIAMQRREADVGYPVTAIEDLSISAVAALVWYSKLPEGHPVRNAYPMFREDYKFLEKSRADGQFSWKPSKDSLWNITGLR